MRDEVESLVQSSDASEESSYDSRRGANNIAASARGNSNVIKNLKEDSATFCAINSVFVIFFVVSCVGVAVAAYAVTSDKEQQEFEEKVSFLILYC